MKPQKKRTMQQLQSDLDTRTRMYIKATAREEFLIDIVRKFHLEIENVGIPSEAMSQSMCIWAGDWKASIDAHLERLMNTKHQGGAE